MTRLISEYGDWQASSSRHKNNIECAYKDADNPETYWSSDSAAEHHITVTFPCLTCVAKVAIYFDYEHDESYTVQQIQFQCGTSIDDLQDLHFFDAEENPGFDDFMEGPQGWQVIELGSDTVYYFVLRLVIKKNFLDGRDTRIRGIKFFGCFFPKREARAIQEDLRK
uniref:Anaphase-promoting complex subunit 10 n=1 Tax=Metchnikovella dogieli TaxID=2804710 RepID=A0A896WNE5_9MICR|nr:anaphase-promoting complex subunit 10 [Metchnikovella dogieli]